MFGESFN